MRERMTRLCTACTCLVSVADPLNTRSAAGRLVLNNMVSVSQWEREGIGERRRDLTECEVAEQIRVSVASLRRWRLEGKGPPFKTPWTERAR